MKRALTLHEGIAMIVTDLHGNAEAYNQVKAQFLKHYDKGEVQYLILLGDLIHPTHPKNPDASLNMLMDVMGLQEQLGKSTVMMLCGNHEMPHIYGQTLARGEVEYTPAFEAALARLENSATATYRRAEVIQFLSDLPFMVFTMGGVLLNHAGATPIIQDKRTTLTLLNYDHQTVIDEMDRILDNYDLNHARKLYAAKIGMSYDMAVLHYLAVTDQHSPRYNNLLRTFVSENIAVYRLLWEFLFARNEQDISPREYERVCERYLECFSMVAERPLKVMVAGHIPVRGGHQVVNSYHLRLATHAHANPQKGGQYLLLDCAQPIQQARQLTAHLHPLQ
ncbi:MAG: metallophosphoesterase [Phototrophicaceae bacterium]